MNPPMKVSDLALRCRKIKPSICFQTWRQWKQAIKVIEDVCISEIDIEFVWDYVDTQSELLTEGTVKKRVGYLSGIWNRGIKLESLRLTLGIAQGRT